MAKFALRAAVLALLAGVKFLALAGVAQADLASGFEQFAQQNQQNSTKNQQNGAKNQQNSTQPPGGQMAVTAQKSSNSTDAANSAQMARQQALNWLATFSGIEVISLNLERKNLAPNCQLENPSAPRPNGFLRFRCGRHFAFLRYELRAQVRALRLAQDVARGQALAAVAQAVYVPLDAQNSALLSELAPGAVAKSRLAKNTLLRERHVSAPKIIKKGDSVAIKITDGALEISQLATALNDASAGQKLRLQLQNGRKITAIAVASGLAEAK